MSFNTSLKSLTLAAASALALNALIVQSSAADTVEPLWRFHLTTETIAPIFGASDKAFWGDTTTFYNGVNPYSTDVNFWGTINPQPALKDSKGAAIPGVVNYSSVAPFWTALEAKWAPISSSWGQRSSNDTSQAPTIASLKSMISSASAYWDPYFQAKYKTSYYNKIIAPIFNQRGVDLNDPSSLDDLDEGSRDRLFLQIYDTTMNDVAAPRVDYWMGMVHWSPALAQTQGLSNPSTVGLLAYTVADPLRGGQSWNGNAGDTALVQGDTLASLIAAPVANGRVMGVSPHTVVTGYNPFKMDPKTQLITAGWDQIDAGISFLAARGASVVDIAVSTPGYTLSPTWASLVNNIDVQMVSGSTLFVLAAGNDGATQRTNVKMNAALAPSFIVVGSVGLDGVISTFSNRPGNVCVIDEKVCAPGDLLSHHFLVAPGEQVLAGTSSGGSVRISGTGYAASLVTGAAALIQTRWPWLTQFPDVTSTILLKSATPLGQASGSDRDFATYGYGLLNIQASQSPLDFNSLIYYSTSTTKGVTKSTQQSVSQVVSAIKTGAQASFNASALYYTAIEPLPGTFRDFKIPLSSKLVGQSTSTSASVNQPFEAFLTSGLTNWAKAHKFTEDGDSLLDGRSLGFAQSSAPAGKIGDLDVRMKLTENTPADGYRQSAVGAKSELALSDKRGTLRFGYGDGAPVLDGMAGLGFGRDYDTTKSGANPLLALASGGEFMNLNANLVPGLALSAGVTRRHDERDFSQLGAATPTAASGAFAYNAQAEHVGLSVSLNPQLVVRASLTRLHEESGLLGIQSMDRQDLSNGSVSNGRSLGFDYRLGEDFLLSASGTWTTTEANSAQALSIAPGGLRGVAAEAALAKANLFAQGDMMRVTVSQPMRVEGGSLQYRDYGVVDRTTGALGYATQTVSAASSQHPIALDLLYERPISSAAFALYARAERGVTDPLNPQISPNTVSYVGGAKVKIAF